MGVDLEAARASARSWAQAEAGVRAIGLAGSQARGDAGPESDVDLVILVEQPSAYRSSSAWVADLLGPGVRIGPERVWGRLVERRAWTPDGVEWELGVVDLGWAGRPVDRGTSRVVRDGFAIWYDADGDLAALVDEVGPSLRANCQQCSGLCCVAPGFARGADFAISKAPGTPCPHLGADSACGIHADLRPRGFPGCVVYDCHGAGQLVTQAAGPVGSWRRGPVPAEAIFRRFAVVRAAHELRWLVEEALDLLADPGLASAFEATPSQVVDELSQARARLLAAARGPAPAGPDAAAQLIGGLRAEVNPLLLSVSETVRRWRRSDPPDLRGADLAGHALGGADLQAASLRGALLVAADLESARLGWADLTGADLRGARLAGADLAEALFVTQSQLEAASGDAATAIPSRLRRPAHWAAQPR